MKNWILHGFRLSFSEDSLWLWLHVGCFFFKVVTFKTGTKSQEGQKERPKNNMTHDGGAACGPVRTGVTARDHRTLMLTQVRVMVAQHT